MAVANLPEYGGYDHELFKKASQKFTCNICTKVLRDPHLTACCGEHFCQSCLEYWFEKHGRKSCPHCQEEEFNHFLNKEKKREIGELKIHCTLRKDGCQWVGELDSLQTHLNSDRGCGYMEVSCTNKCGKKMKRKDLKRNLKRHLTKECPLRKCKCERCGREDTYLAITGDTGDSEYPSRRNHHDECPNFPLDCPNRCGGTAIPRKYMSDHRAKCPLEPVECPFKEAGCKARVVRMNYIEHMTSNIQQHLLLTVQMLQKKCGEYERRLAAVEELQLQFQIAKAGASYYMHPLLEGCTEEQKAPLLHIQALLDDPKQLHLKNVADIFDDNYDDIFDENFDAKIDECSSSSVTIAMPEFSQYKQSGKVWHSPPFYYGKGYKMCLAVYTNVTGAYASVSLLLLRGEFDDRLKWPMQGGGIEIELLVPFIMCTWWFSTYNLHRVLDDENSRVASETGFKYYRGNLDLNCDSIVLRVTNVAVALEEDIFHTVSDNIYNYDRVYYR